MTNKNKRNVYCYDLCERCNSKSCNIEIMKGLNVPCMNLKNKNEREIKIPEIAKKFIDKLFKKDTE